MTVPLSIAEILALDEEYRQKAAEDQLRKIAPKEYNPEHEAWLPVMYRRLDDARVTILFSNTRLAHELDKTHDWVSLFYKPVGGVEAQCTVVTEWHQGPLLGKRVVRGKEKECLAHYAAKSPDNAA